jgi:small subunit ribosomal protein S21
LIGRDESVGLHKSNVSYYLPGAERKSGRGMIKVKARGNESVEQMIKRFKKMCEKEGLTKDIKRNSYYEKPSDRKRRRQRKSVKRVIMNYGL